MISYPLQTHLAPDVSSEISPTRSYVASLMWVSSMSNFVVVLQAGGGSGVEVVQWH